MPANGGPTGGSEPAKSRFMAVKTNFAYDVFALPNVEYEVQVADRFSVSIPVALSLWDLKHDLALRTVAIQPECRYWINRIGAGHAFSVNAGCALFNCRHDRYRYQNRAMRPLLSAGAGYTYSLRFAGRWAVEFSLAVGYVNARYNRYYNIDNGAKIDTKTMNYFGPTKIGITLSYRLSK